MTVKAVWHIVKESTKSIGVAKLAPHDLRLRAGREQSRPATRLLGGYGVMAWATAQSRSCE